MRKLEDKVALITGAGTGIGRASAELFAAEGARLVLLGRRVEPLEKLSGELKEKGVEALALSCDVSDSASVARAFAETEKKFGRLDVLVNNAGAIYAGTVENTPEEEWDRLMAINLKGPYLASRAALPLFRKAGRGSIVNIGSMLGLIGIRNRAAYCATKGGLTLLTKAMALDHAHEKIRVNCICPAAVETELLTEAFSQYPDPAAEKQRRVEQIPLQRIGEPKDVAHMALYLASDDSSWVTGASFPVDGGVTAA
ncbi:MAG: glucose 1-dehydrogenase [Acidobacteria bacterium]|nr:glucose 1-dehydrogenase [Acidobacteriota bacterium]